MYVPAIRIPTYDDTLQTNEIFPHTLLNFLTGEAVYSTTFCFESTFNILEKWNVKKNIQWISVY